MSTRGLGWDGIRVVVLAIGARRMITVFAQPDGGHDDHAFHDEPVRGRDVQPIESGN